MSRERGDGLFDLLKNTFSNVIKPSGKVSEEHRKKLFEAV